MVDLQTDEEKAEAIKKWWKENGIAVVSGVAIGLAAIFGWRAWTNYQEQLGQQASLTFEELLFTVGQTAMVPPAETSADSDAETEAGAPEAGALEASAPEASENPLLVVATEQQARLEEDFSATPYVFFGSLAMAKAQNDLGQLDAAADTLRTAMSQAPTALLKTLAGLRLARVLVAAADYATAKRVIEEHQKAGSFAGDFAALRGDIALAENRIEDARAAYEQAVAENAAAAGLIRLKLQDLAPPADS
jgi:predicted negative regulator of RcsB-dependent stress response